MAVQFDRPAFLKKSQGQTLCDDVEDSLTDGIFATSLAVTSQFLVSLAAWHYIATPSLARAEIEQVFPQQVLVGAAFGAAVSSISFIARRFFNYEFLS